LHPGRKNILAGAGEADLARRLIVNERGTGCGGANEIVRQYGGPHFTVNHLRRLATHVTKIQIRFDTPDVQLCIPTKSIDRGNVLLGVCIRIDKRRDDVDRLGTTIRLGNVETNFSQQKSLGNLPVVSTFIQVGRSGRVHTIK